MRYLVTFLCICGLVLIAFIGCLGGGKEEGCEGGCPTDGNLCTREFCSRATGTGSCVSRPVEDGTNCTFDGRVCISGVCEKDVVWCGGVLCEDGNDCTGDTCDYVEGACDYSPAQDGTACSGGVCLDGLCDILVDQCTATDLAAIGTGDEPGYEALVDCTWAAVAVGPGNGNLQGCLNIITDCLFDAGTTLTGECSYCFASGACCVVNECSPWVGGPCTDEPQPGDACDMCIQEFCQPQVDACIGGQ